MDLLVVVLVDLLVVLLEDLMVIFLFLRRQVVALEH